MNCRSWLLIALLLCTGTATHADSIMIIHPIPISSTNQLDHHLVVQVSEYPQRTEYDLETMEPRKPTSPPTVGVTILVPSIHNGKRLETARLYARWPDGRKIQLGLNMEKMKDGVKLSFMLDKLSCLSAKVQFSLNYDGNLSSDSRHFVLELEKYLNEKKEIQQFSARYRLLRARTVRMTLAQQNETENHNLSHVRWFNAPRLSHRSSQRLLRCIKRSNEFQFRAMEETGRT